MEGFITDTEQRIEKISKLISTTTDPKIKEDLTAKLNNWIVLKEIYVKIRDHNREVEATK